MSSPNGAYALDSTQGYKGLGARLHLVGASTEMGHASFFQSANATPSRGKWVQLRVRIRSAQPQARPVLFLTVIKTGNIPSGATTFTPQKITRDGWALYQVLRLVPSDAVKLWMGIGVDGNADITVDDFSLREISSSSASPSPAAASYLAKAIDIIRTHHINSAQMDWSKLAADARAQIAGARKPADTYAAIQSVLLALHEPHSSFLPPFAAPGHQESAGLEVKPVMPSGRLLPDMVAELELPSLNTLGANGPQLSQAYRSAAEDALKRLDRGHLCGWIIDLRRNGGGDMWPMLDAIDPLLGKGPFGWFVEPNGETEAWQRSNGAITPGNAVEGSDKPAYQLNHATLPVAVLIGPGTASSGEMTLAALTGREGVKTFGTNTAGFTTANRVFPLSDGARLVVTSSKVRDRTGRNYEGSITPDAVVQDADVEKMASEWLEQKCSRPSASSQ